ncbi:hypothetical protein ACQI4L_26230 [Mycolicibacterium litorale]|uniref:hypothetical protein n=1 Tax=Mycolicibacterium litorale TaxID=758802 RepID=UPI003CEE522E
MITNPVDIAKQVTRWTNLGIDLPEDLITALDRFEALQFVEVGHRPVFDLESVTAENAEEKVREFAEVLANHIPMRLQDGVSATVLESSKSWALNEAALAVKRTAAQSIPQIIEDIEPRFEEHAEAYAEAALKLPETITSDTLVKAGPETLAAYGVAKAEAAYIGGISSWVNQTAEVTGVRSTGGFLNVLAPDDAVQLAKLDQVSLSTNTDRTFAEVVPVYFTAVRLGVPFRIKTPREASALRKELELALRSQSQRPTGVAFA